MLQSTNFYLLRAPLYSKEKLIKLNTALEERNYSLVRKIFSDDLFLNAIYLSSKDFYFIAKSWLDQSIEYFEFRDKVFISLYKYYNRLCTRATPYGFFSGFSTGEIDNFPTNIKRDDKNPFNFHVRPDMGYIEDVKNSIINSNSSSNFEYVPNNSIYKISNKIRYVLRDVNNNFEICEIKINFILNKLLGFTKDGKTKIEIIGFLEKLNFKKEEILEYLHQLIESQILVVKCPPFLSSNSQYSDFFKFFEKFEKSTELQKKIEKIKSNINPLYNTANFLAQLNLSSQDSIDQFVQIDTELNMKNNHINKKVVNNITKTK